jgi:hypothetical protein
MSKPRKFSRRRARRFAPVPFTLCAKKFLSRREPFLDCDVLLIKIVYELKPPRPAMAGAQQKLIIP